MLSPSRRRSSLPKGRTLALALLLAGLGSVAEARAQEADWRQGLPRLPGEIDLAVDPAHATDGEPPVLRLGYRTVHEYSCYGYRIVADLERSADSLHLEIHGVDMGGPLCSPAFGPATGSADFDVPPGDYALTVSHRDSADAYRLEVREDRVRLVPGRTGFTIPDTRLKWLFPERSFAVYCGTTEDRRPLCARLAAWIESLPGLRAFSFGEDGVVPYRRGIGTHHRERQYFRYAEEEDLSPVANCLERLARRTGPLKGIHLSAELWTGEGGPTAPGPSAEVVCVPSLPDPAAADSRTLEWEDARDYAVAWDYHRGYDPERAPPDRVAAWDGRVMVSHPRRPAPPPPPRADTVDGRVTITVPLPGPGQTGGVDRFEPRPRRSVILPPDRYTRALPRAAFHARLEEWWMRGGKTLGDPERHPDRAWVWAEDDLEWYFLLGETTDAGVRAYLDLVERHGTEIEWRVEDERARSPQRVRIGPEGAVIPGFLFYRWRD